MNQENSDDAAINALLDEYKKAITELKSLIVDIPEAQLSKVMDKQTIDEDCKSIQSILMHVIQAGYTYVIEVRRFLGENIEYKEKELLTNSIDICNALDAMFSYNEQLFLDYPEVKLEEFNSEKKINVRWGQQYDVEQLFEHAIVHILRHRRQISFFIKALI